MRSIDVVVVVVFAVYVVATARVDGGVNDGLASTVEGEDSCDADSGAVNCNARGSTSAHDKV